MITMKKYLLILYIFPLLLFIPIFRANAAVPIKILLVPGHDNEVWGAQYGNVKEADMNLNLATRIYNLLKKDKRFEVHITRKIGGYTKEFADYFAAHREDIKIFRDAAIQKTEKEINSGDFLERNDVPHNAANKNVSIILYGINKWADENKMDAVIHIHFNDYPRPDKWTKGKYKGFAIYRPEGQMVNWQQSGRLAASIFTQLKKKYTTSDYEKEIGGLIPDQKLIALGSNGTLGADVRSVLIEYGYIYRFPTKKSRFNAYNNMASLTVAGIKNHFFPK